MMKTIRNLIAASLVGLAGLAQAQTDISGTWTGDLPAGPNATLEIHFIVTREGDGYSTVLTSPNQGAIQNMPATSTTFDGSKLVLTVDDLAGRYEGTLENGTFSGNWYQQGQALPLNLTPFVERVLSEEQRDLLRGSWVGSLTTQGVTLSIVYRFEDDGNGNFVGLLDSPDQGARGIPMSAIKIADGKLSFEIPQIFATYTASLAGDAMDGTLTQLGMPTPLKMMRGEYAARGIALAPEAIERLEGSWVGRLPNPAGGTVPIVFRFERSDDGGVAGYLDSPQEGARGIPMSEITLEGNEFAIVIPAARASFSGALANGELDGTWAQGNASTPLTMVRGEYVAETAALDLSDEAFARLAGTWRGQMGPLELIVRFETSADGAHVAFLDVPAQGASGLTVSEATLDADSLVFRLPAIGVVYTGTLDGDSVAGQWQQGQANNPLTLTRDRQEP